MNETSNGNCASLSMPYTSGVVVLKKFLINEFSKLVVTTWVLFLKLFNKLCDVSEELSRTNNNLLSLVSSNKLKLLIGL